MAKQVRLSSIPLLPYHLHATFGISTKAHQSFKHVQLTYNRCYSLVADLRGPVAGWGWPAAPHPTIISYLSSSLSPLTDASGALYSVQKRATELLDSKRFYSFVDDPSRRNLQQAGPISSIISYQKMMSLKRLVCSSGSKLLSTMTYYHMITLQLKCSTQSDATVSRMT